MQTKRLELPLDNRRLARSSGRTRKRFPPSFLLLVAFLVGASQTSLTSARTIRNSLLEKRQQLERLEDLQNCSTITITQKSDKNSLKNASKRFSIFQLENEPNAMIICEFPLPDDPPRKWKIITLKTVKTSVVSQLPPLLEQASVLNFHGGRDLCHDPGNSNLPPFLAKHARTIRIFGQHNECLSLYKFLANLKCPNVKTIEFRRVFFGAGNSEYANRFLVSNPAANVVFTRISACVDCIPRLTHNVWDQEAKSRRVTLRNLETNYLRAMLKELGQVRTIRIHGGSALCDGNRDKGEKDAEIVMDYTKILEIHGPKQECLPMYQLLANVKLMTVESVQFQNVFVGAGNVAYVNRLLRNGNPTEVSFLRVIACNHCMDAILKGVKYENLHVFMRKSN